MGVAGQSLIEESMVDDIYPKVPRHYGQAPNRRPHLKSPEHKFDGHTANQHYTRLSVKPHVHHGPDGKRRYHHSHGLHLLPTSLQQRHHDARQEVADRHYEQMTTPVPTNPAQCPNLPMPHQVRNDYRKAIQAAIDDWHDENPDHRVEDHHG